MELYTENELKDILNVTDMELKLIKTKLENNKGCTINGIVKVSTEPVIPFGVVYLNGKLYDVGYLIEDVVMVDHFAISDATLEIGKTIYTTSELLDISSALIDFNFLKRRHCTIKTVEV